MSMFFLGETAPSVIIDDAPALPQWGTHEEGSGKNLNLAQCLLQSKLIYIYILHFIPGEIQGASQKWWYGNGMYPCIQYISIHLHNLETNN